MNPRIFRGCHIRGRAIKIDGLVKSPKRTFYEVIKIAQMNLEMTFLKPGRALLMVASSTQ